MRPKPLLTLVPSLYKVNERPCYRVNVDARTLGAFDLVTRIRDTWRSYIDTSAILPQKFYTNLQENKYRKEENITFNHETNTVKAEERTEKDVFKVPDNVHDLISGYYFLRTIDFSNISSGQIIEVPAFYDDTVYNMKVRYRGKDVVKTKHGKINVIKLNPVLPQATSSLRKKNPSVFSFPTMPTKYPLKWKSISGLARW